MDRKIGRLTLREMTAVALLAALLLFGLLTSWYMGRQHRTISRGLEESGWMALSGQWSDAREKAQEVKSAWEKNRQLRAALADHTPMEEIDRLFEELTIYAAAGERTEFARCCAALSSHVRAVGEAHRLTWWNVL